MKGGDFMIFGCGPAGLLAAYALEQTGRKFDIMSMKIESKIRGAQYLHRPIPGLTSDNDAFTISVFKVGTKEGYIKKAYRDFNTDECSWDHIDEGNHDVWSMRKVYRKLWKRYEGQIVDFTVDNTALRAAMDVYRYVILAVPLPTVCAGGHEFDTNSNFAAKEGDGRPDKAVMVYDGDHSQKHHRLSVIDGELWKEYGRRADAPVDAQMVIKPQWNNCTCCGDNVIKVGRYGRWERDELADAAYWGIREFVEAAS